MRILVSCLLFIVCVVGIDRLLGRALAHVSTQIETGDRTGGLAKQAVKHRDFPILVFGSSRALHHVVPSVLEARLGLKVWNAGVDGQSIEYARFVQALMLQQKSRAKLLVLTSEPSDFTSARFRGFLLPEYFGASEEIDALLLDRSRFEFIKLLSHSYRYNSRILAMARQLVKPDVIGHGGYVPLTGELPEGLSSPPPPVPEESTFADSEKYVRLYRDFIQAARLHQMEVLLVIPPRYVAVNSQDAVWERGMRTFRKLADETHAELFRYDGRPEFANRKVFRDAQHLNDQGARDFSQLLAADIAVRYPELARAR